MGEIMAEEAAEHRRQRAAGKWKPRRSDDEALGE